MRAELLKLWKKAEPDSSRTPRKQTNLTVQWSEHGPCERIGSPSVRPPEGRCGPWCRPIRLPLSPPGCWDLWIHRPIIVEILMPILTNSRNDLEQAIEQAVDFLYAAQLPSGAFQIFCSPHPLLEEECKPDYSTFQTAQISYCLNFTKSDKVAEIAGKAIRSLVNVMQDGCVWRIALPA